MPNWKQFALALRDVPSAQILKYHHDVRSPFPDLRGARKRRGADGAAVGVSRGTGAPETDRIRDSPRRPAAERICRAVRRAAGLADRLYRLGRPGHRADPARPRCSSTAAIRCRPPSRSIPRPGASSRWSTRRRKPGWRKHLAAGDRLGFDPWLHTSAAAERLAAACAKAGAELVAVDSNPLDAGVDRAPGAAARPGRHSRHAIFRRDRGRQAQADPRSRSPSSASTRWCCRIRMRWPGPSTSAAPTSRIRRCRCPMRWCRRTAGPTVFIDHRKLSNSARDHLEQSADVAEPDALTPKLTELAAARRLDRARQRHRRRCAEPPDRRRRRQAGARQRSGQPAQGGQERRPRSRARTTAHRRDAVALARFLAWIDREAPVGRADRDRRRRGAGDLPPRHRRAEGRFVSDHRRHRAERRHRALPRHPQDQPPHRARRSAADRFRRAI